MKDGAMNLADELAVQRTTLANERTWLAYLRTALTLFVAGVTFVQFFSSRIIQLIGWGFIPLGMVTALGMEALSPSAPVDEAAPQERPLMIPVGLKIPCFFHSRA